MAGYENSHKLQQLCNYYKGNQQILTQLKEQADNEQSANEQSANDQLTQLLKNFESDSNKKTVNLDNEFEMVKQGYYINDSISLLSLIGKELQIMITSQGEVNQDGYCHLAEMNKPPSKQPSPDSSCKMYHFANRFNQDRNPNYNNWADSKWLQILLSFIFYFDDQGITRETVDKCKDNGENPFDCYQRQGKYLQVIAPLKRDSTGKVHILWKRVLTYNNESNMYTIRNKKSQEGKKFQLYLINIKRNDEIQKLLMNILKTYTTFYIVHIICIRYKRIIILQKTQAITVQRAKYINLNNTLFIMIKHILLSIKKNLR